MHDVLTVLSNLVRCISHLLPAIEKGRAKLIYDSLIEQKSLINNENLMRSINNIHIISDEAPDIRKLWFTYTKNRTQPIDLLNTVNDLKVTSSEGVSKVINGLNERAINDDVIWLSFGNHAWTETAKYCIDYNSASVNIKNAYNPDSLKKLLPSFECSDKHGASPYIDAAGEHVSAMKLNKMEADKLLLISVKHGNDLWAYYEEKEQYYRFKLTYIGRSIYHGFEIEPCDLPVHVHELLKNKM